MAPRGDSFDGDAGGQPFHAHSSPPLKCCVPSGARLTERRKCHGRDRTVASVTILLDGMELFLFADGLTVNAPLSQPSLPLFCLSFPCLEAVLAWFTPGRGCSQQNSLPRHTAPCLCRG